MTQHELERDLAVITAAAAIIITALGIAGPIAALIVGALMIPAAAIGMLAYAVRQGLTEIDGRCTEIDQQLDQEAEARRALRTQHTVTAQVIPVDFGRRGGDAA